MDGSPLLLIRLPAVWHSHAARGPSTPSFDHLVGAGEERRWHIEAKRPCRLQVDDELKLGRPQDRHVGRFLAVENATGIDAELAMLVSDVRSVAQHPAAFGKRAIKINRRHPMIYRQRGELHETGVEQWVWTDH